MRASGKEPGPGRDRGLRWKRWRNACRRARKLAEARAAMLAAVSHDMRDPLNSLIGMARLLRDTPLDGEQREFVDTIIEAGEALHTLVNELLDLSRIDAGRLELAPTAVAVRPFLERLAAHVRARAKAKGLAFELAIAPSVPETLEFDPTRLRRALLNLLGNALKFTSQGRIALRASAEPHAQGVLLRIEVADTGIGMTEEEQRRLFTPWTQIGAARGGSTAAAGSDFRSCAASWRRWAAAFGARADPEREPPSPSSCPSTVPERSRRSRPLPLRPSRVRSC